MSSVSNCVAVVVTRLCIAVCIGTFAPAAIHAQRTSDSGTFVLRLANDTLGVERFRRTNDSISGVIAARTPNDPRVQHVRYAASLGPRSTVTAIDLTTWIGADSTPGRRAMIRFATDSAGSAVAEVRQGSGGAARRIPTTSDAMPMLSASLALTELLIQRAAALGGLATDVPVFNLVGGRTDTTHVIRRGADSVLLQTAGTRLMLVVDARLRLLRGGDPARRLAFDRVGSLARMSFEEALKRDYAAPAGAPYTAEEVQISAAGGVTLGGTLTLPRGGGRPLGAAILIPGSSTADRDLRVGDYALFRWLADTLSRRGIAVLRVDDRGVGSSGGSRDGTTIDEHAADIRAEIAYLRSRADIAPRRIALLGISEGGLLAPLVASMDPGIAAIVTLAGPASTGRALARYQRAFRLARDSAQLAPAARDRSVRAAMQVLDSSAGARPWLRSILDYDPMVVARRVRVPALILHGATDGNVPVHDAERLAAAMRSNGNRDVTVRVLPNTNHIFVPDRDGDPRRYLGLPALRVPPETLGLIADWASRHVGPGRSSATGSWPPR